MNVKIPMACKRFRSSVLPMAFFLFITTGLLGFGFIFMFEREPFNLPALKAAGVFCLVYAWIASWAISRIWPVAVSSDGLFGPSFSGKHVFIRWSDISAVRPLRLVNLPYLRIYGQGKVIWLPLFQSHLSEFRQEVHRLAPTENPVLNSV